jgi:xanthine dehydrogenase accessory factor
VFDDFLKLSAELVAKGEAFAMATVVRCQPPASGKPGDKAIVHGEGRLSGWIGGGCAQPVVIREALKAIADGNPRFVRISPSPGAEEGVVDYTMTCHSGGALDIFIEPVTPKLHVLVLGRSPVAQALARLASSIGYDVTIVTAAAGEDDFGFGQARIIRAQDFDLRRVKITPQTYLVVSTQGEGDEEALEQAIRSADAVPYLAFVASKIKAEKVFEYLRDKGVAAEQIRRVRAPAGLDLGAASPEEIAVSILAEVVQVSRAKQTHGQLTRHESAISGGPPESSDEAEARDPICGMAVNISKATYKSEHQGMLFYFCCAGCKQQFERNQNQSST